ncbi:Allatostatin C [Frankliniella occidentalis]|uniref:Uncharacterized protein LOC113209180 n=1 Tax=Frankliniella occidentalis TaxID=133901 RepID=A0A6J1SM38_FRAOC|nr:uncharacterized protein LOC113209180 [Frankliniella occidentalis]KAE8745392.1 Allatostatin C [Frankliniella occidentalis]
MAPSWTPLPSPRPAGCALLSVGLLLLALGVASAAVVRGQREEANPLTLLLLRGLGGAPAGALVAEAVQLDDGMDVPSSSAAALRRMPPVQAADGDLGDTIFLRAAKRQVRYHQCYFNPISCFG